MDTPLTREQQIIKAFIEGKSVAPAEPARVLGRTADNSSAKGSFGFGLSAETMEKLEKRKAQEGFLEKARSGKQIAEDAEPVEKVRSISEGENYVAPRRGGGEVDRDALRRDILGADRARKLRAQAKFTSQNASRKPYVKVADRI